MNANEMADLMIQFDSGRIYEHAEEIANMLRNQQTQIDRLNYELDGFKQNFFVSGFQLQIKMANEQLVKQQEQIESLKSELRLIDELVTGKAQEK